LVLRVASAAIRRQARRAGLHYSFLFMASSGEQLAKLTALIEKGDIRPIVDRVFPFEQTNEALAYVETGRAKGKVVIKVI
jgi:NADPH:quinone reductase-like Zn-dependent oxidoreductase